MYSPCFLWLPRYPLSSVICLPSSVVCRLSSVVCHMSSVICHLSSVICHLSSVVCRLSSFIFHVSSVICHLSSVICHLPSVICNLSSVVCRLSSVICHLSYVICRLSSVDCYLLGQSTALAAWWCCQWRGRRRGSTSSSGTWTATTRNKQRQAFKKIFHLNYEEFSFPVYSRSLLVSCRPAYFFVQGPYNSSCTYIMLSHNQMISPRNGSVHSICFMAFKQAVTALGCVFCI